MDSDKIPKKLVKATIYTKNNLKIEGSVFTGADIRLSDEFSLTIRKFVFLKDATVTMLNTEITVRHDTLFLSKDQVILVSPQE